MKAHATATRLIAAVAALAGVIFAATAVTHAQQSARVAISVKGHRFSPAEVHAPANTPLAISGKNLDTTPMEFESVSLRVEKVITGGSAGVVNVRPLSPGRYEFYDDFHQETRGTLVVQ
jgi:hypothetical protein